MVFLLLPLPIRYLLPQVKGDLGCLGIHQRAKAAVQQLPVVRGQLAHHPLHRTRVELVVQGEPLAAGGRLPQLIDVRELAPGRACASAAAAAAAAATRTHHLARSSGSVISCRAHRDPDGGKGVS